MFLWPVSVCHASLKNAPICRLDRPSTKCSTLTIRCNAGSGYSDWYTKTKNIHLSHFTNRTITNGEQTGGHLVSSVGRGGHDSTRWTNYLKNLFIKVLIIFGNFCVIRSVTERLKPFGGRGGLDNVLGWISANIRY